AWASFCSRASGESGWNDWRVSPVAGLTEAMAILRLSRPAAGVIPEQGGGHAEEDQGIDDHLELEQPDGFNLTGGDEGHRAADDGGHQSRDGGETEAGLAIEAWSGPLGECRVCQRCEQVKIRDHLQDDGEVEQQHVSLF